MQCVVKIVKGGKNIISDGFSWVRVEFFFSFYGGVGGGGGRGVALVFLNFTDVKGGVHEAYSNPFVKWFDD